MHAAQNTIMASWRKGTTKQYRSYLSRWTNFCKKQQISPYSPGTTKAIEFLTELFHSGVGYSAINTARSALSSIILPTAGIPFGKDPLVCRFLKGVFRIKAMLSKIFRNMGCQHGTFSFNKIWHSLYDDLERPYNELSHITLVIDRTEISNNSQH